MQREPELLHEDILQLRTQAPEAIPDVEYQHRQLGARRKRYDVPPAWQAEYGDPRADPQSYMEEESEPPPPPPRHSNSAPTVPQYTSNGVRPRSRGLPDMASQNMRHHSIPAVSPVQSAERIHYVQPHTPGHSPAFRDSSIDHNTPSPDTYAYKQPSPYSHTSNSPSPYAGQYAANTTINHRNSVADPYGVNALRPHPLSQEIPRSRSPRPDQSFESSFSGQHHENDHSPRISYRSQETAPLMKPRAISPQRLDSGSRPRPRSEYDIRHPVRALESADHSPLSASQQHPRVAAIAKSTPVRKSVSPQPSPSGSAGGTPFSPDSFDAFNPNARSSPLGNHSSPQDPYRSKSDPDVHHAR